AANLAQRGRDVGLRQRAAAGKAVQDRAKAFLQRFKHVSSFSLPSMDGREVVPLRPFSKRNQSRKAPGGASRCRVLASGVDTQPRKARRPGQLREKKTCRRIVRLRQEKRAGVKAEPEPGQGLRCLPVPFAASGASADEPEGPGSARCRRSR